MTLILVRRTLQGQRQAPKMEEEELKGGKGNDEQVALFTAYKIL